MKYVLLLTVRGVVDEPPDPTDPAVRELMRRYHGVRSELVDTGIWCGGEALQPPTMGTGVRVRDQMVQIENAPHAQAPERLIGYYLVDCDDLDHAVEVASRLPAAEYGSVEVRPVWDYEALM